MVLRFSYGICALIGIGILMLSPNCSAQAKDCSADLRAGEASLMADNMFDAELAYTAILRSDAYPLGCATTAYENLALICARYSKPHQFKSCAERLIEMAAKRSLLNENASVIISRLAQVYEEDSRFSDAESALLQLLLVVRNSNDDITRQIRSTYYGRLARLAEKQGRSSIQESYLVAQLSLLDEIDPKDAFLTTSPLLSLGKIYTKSGRHYPAIAILKRGVSAAEELWGKESDVVAEALEYYSTSLAAVGLSQEAQTTSSRAIEIRKKKTSEKSSDIKK